MGLLDRFTTKRNAKKGLAVPRPAVDVAAENKSASASAEMTPAVARDSASPARAVLTGKGRAAYAILLRPVVTEKAARGESASQYSFIIPERATKGQVKQAVFNLYGSMPVGVNVVHMPGKRVRFGKTFGRRADYKKAVVTMAKGITLPLHQGV